ncbi:hypothetical protein EROM_041450 [Encephalitozoon romaleae SJ-2008]|uniref:Uncharacterized protein n=1 Tax=Encephalitozoon romaleae (strain SJ-2008) TaxID=1178016 RepID=I7AMH5_ENCRO|nr:hypothetical protein EROM_041450 [Encephalitozoon romaleae SJ-2008]AFN82909.1 hypothetical protein EROM_041450 [Encephalitozoon romaleae SJ-2008]
MEEYTLCSSSTEQGEIPVIHVKRFKEEPPLFPRTRSQLQYMYLPNKPLFVGPNTIPRSCDYQANVLTTKLKKRLKHDLPYPFLCLSMNSDKTFFEDKFALVSKVHEVENVVSDLFLTKTKERIIHIKDEVGTGPEGRNEIKLEHIKDKQNDTYKDACQDFLAGKLFEDGEARRVNIIIKDSTINSLLKKDAYIHFYVKKKDGKLYAVFDEVYTREIKYYDYLSRYGEEVIRSLKSSEIRVYSSEEVTVAVYSSTLFYSSSGIQRLFYGIDVEKSIDVVVNIEDVRAVRSSGALGDEMKVIFGIGVEEGEYVLNDGRIYAVSPNGEKFVFDGVVFTDFLDNQESTSD